MAGMAGNADARDGLALARLEYLYGYSNGGVPQRSRAVLLELSGVTRNTLALHVATWEKESEEIARYKAQSELGLVLNEATFEKHRHDTEWLRTAMDNAKRDYDNTSDIADELHNLIDGIRDNVMLTADDFDSLSRMVENYLRLHVTKASTLKLFLALNARWAESSAVSAMLGAHSAQLRETAKIKAKQAAHAAEGESGLEDRTPKDAGERAKGNALFKRG